MGKVYHFFFFLAALANLAALILIGYKVTNPLGPMIGLHLLMLVIFSILWGISIEEVCK